MGKRIPVDVVTFERRYRIQTLEKLEGETDHAYKFRKLIFDKHREMLKSKNLTNEKLAKAIDKSPVLISLVEAGKRRFDLDVIPDLAKALELNKKDLSMKALEAYYPNLYKALFGKPAPEPKPLPPGETTTIQVPTEAVEFWQQFGYLAEDVRKSFYKIVQRLYDFQRKELLPMPWSK